MTFHEPHLGKLAVFFLFFFCAEIQCAVIYMDLLFNGEAGHIHTICNDSVKGISKDSMVQ